MTRPILDFQAAEMAADDEGLGLCYGKREFRDHLEAQAQQAVAAERAKYAPLVKAHREWVEATSAHMNSLGAEDLGDTTAYRRLLEAEDALAALTTEEG